MEKFEEGQNVLCIVERIEGTTVFVKVENNGEGTITTSEIAPGRIRNLRDYVIPGKRIVCKIMRIEQKNLYLSLRRVSGEERKKVLESYEREKNSLSILKSVVKEKALEIAETIKKQENSLYEFLQNCKQDIKLLAKYIPLEEAEKICKILLEKKEKEVEVKKEFKLSSNLPLGMMIIKKILLPYKNNVTYLAASRYLIKAKALDYKKANSEIQKTLEEIEKQANREKIKFEAGK